VTFRHASPREAARARVGTGQDLYYERAKHPMSHQRFCRTHFAFLCVGLLGSLVAACGSSSSTPAAVAGSGGSSGSGGSGGSSGSGGSGGSSGSGMSGNQLLSNQTVGDFPHQIDMYVPEGATRAIVFLHGALGSKESFAYNVGVTDDRNRPTFEGTNWDWLTEHRVIAVVPQGQHLADAALQTTWSNYVMDSGQDDVAFLQALAAEIRDRFGVSEVSLAGHSNGGMMTNRMWCESPETFDAFIGLSGPASEHFLMPGQECAPSEFKPFFGMVGELDDILQVTGNFSEPTYTLVGEDAVNYLDPVLIGEWAQHVSRAKDVCGATPALEDVVTKDDVETWVDCDGSLQVYDALNLSHGLGMPNADAPTQISDMIVDFIDKNLGAP
jgi:poly(3-hydroxybutyrate) depolymerase